MSDRMHRDWPRVALNGVLMLICVVMLYPWLLAIATALKGQGEAGRNPGLIPERIDLGKFVDVFWQVDFPRLAFNSIVITGTTVFLVLLLASLAAYAFARLDFIGKEPLFLFLLLGLMLQATALMIPLFQVNLTLGLLNTHLALIGPYVALGLPFSILILRGFFQALPRELDEAALIDGASPFRIYRQVLLPLTRPALATVGIFVGLSSWNDFLLPMLMTQTTDMRTLPMGLITFVQSGLVTEQENKFAMIVMMTIPVVVAFLLLQRQFLAGMTAGAVKH
ncbi:MAG: carbohydrate ABC transporter permease [Chloroflexi bacterium]|nr:carbohydrate ABC transporter permease [Chloroflexota bacterium]